MMIDRNTGISIGLGALILASVVTGSIWAGETGEKIRSHDSQIKAQWERLNKTNEIQQEQAVTKEKIDNIEKQQEKMDGKLEQILRKLDQ